MAMGRIFISVSHSEERYLWDVATIAAATSTEAFDDHQERLRIRDRVMAELGARGFAVLLVPGDLPPAQAIEWINWRCRPGDIALDMQADAQAQTSRQGNLVYYIARNRERKQQAELLLLALTRRVPQLPIRGAIADTFSSLGAVSFCRQVVVPSLYLQLGFVHASHEPSLMQLRGQEIALGIADGLAAWYRLVAGPQSEPRSPFQQGESKAQSPTSPGNRLEQDRCSPIQINLNGRLYSEQGLVMHGNPYIPVDLVDRLGVEWSQPFSTRRIAYGNVVYMKAIELREANLAVSWEPAAQTITIQTLLPIAKQSHAIAGQGETTEVQMLMFLKMHHQTGLAQFPDIARLYRDEATHEGINHDLAFAQMCVETDFLHFGSGLQPEQNNFGGLGTPGGRGASATFPSVQLGVRAHIQHLKAYANREPLREEVIDPRFHEITRGIAPLVEGLTGRWSADRFYTIRLLAVLRQLYETAGWL